MEYNQLSEKIQKIKSLLPRIIHQTLYCHTLREASRTCDEIKRLLDEIETEIKELNVSNNDYEHSQKKR